MGDPRRIRKKFSGPSHPWQKERIDEEKEFLKEYGLKNKSEVWKADSKLRSFKKQVKKLIRTKTEQSEKEKVQLLTKLVNLGVLPENAGVEDVLGLSIKDILERRLQSVILRKGLARSVKQARQFITHQHIMINNKKITAPGFLVPKGLEDAISFSTSSSLFSTEHPERAVEKKKLAPKEKKKKEAPKKKTEEKKTKPKKAEQKKVKEEKKVEEKKVK
ncbi:30S ribosomal protein S4 [Candidatus Woesearchaeota archaeon]|nr:30S ribosomal protein S4 [Candidatus Woesearchaeota archaeon]